MQVVKINDFFIDKDSVSDCLFLPEMKIIRIVLINGTTHEFKFENENEAESVFNEIIISLEEL